MSTYHDNDFIITGRGESTRLQGAVVNADLFPLLGVAPVIGRGFLPDEDKPGESGRVVVLSQGLFQKRFNSDPNIVNQSMMLDGKNYTIVGVMPNEFQFPIQNDPVELWTTVALDREGKEPITDERGAHYMNVIARLKPGVTKEQAQAEMTSISARLEQQYPDKALHKRSADLCCRGNTAGLCRFARMLYSSAARDAPRSVERTALRVSYQNHLRERVVVV
jgi:hypothetical protein